MSALSAPECAFHLLHAVPFELGRAAVCAIIARSDARLKARFPHAVHVADAHTVRMRGSASMVVVHSLYIPVQPDSLQRMVAPLCCSHSLRGPASRDPALWQQEMDKRAARKADAAARKRAAAAAAFNNGGNTGSGPAAGSVLP